MFYHTLNPVKLEFYFSWGVFRYLSLCIASRARRNRGTVSGSGIYRAPKSGERFSFSWRGEGDSRDWLGDATRWITVTALNLWCTAVCVWVWRRGVGVKYRCCQPSAHHRHTQTHHSKHPKASASLQCGEYLAKTRPVSLNCWSCKAHWQLVAARRKMKDSWCNQYFYICSGLNHFSAMWKGSYANITSSKWSTPQSWLVSLALECIFVFMQCSHAKKKVSLHGKRNTCDM